jgi:hypothetical protein
VQGKSIKRLIAVDPSLTCSGWAVFDVETQRPLEYSVIKPPGTEIGLTERYDWLQVQVVSAFDLLQLGKGDFLICEGPAPLVKNPESSLRVERVRSIFEAVGRMYGVKVLSRLNPRTVQTEVLGLRGKQLPRAQVKELARATALQVFPEIESLNEKKLSQDIVDAILVGMLAVSKIQIHLKTGADLELLFQTKTSGRNSRSWRAFAP